MNIEKTLKQINARLREKGIKDSLIPFLFEQAVNDIVAADASIREHGLIISDNVGSLKKNPAQTVKQASMSYALRVIEQCGLTPKVLKITERPETEDDDPFASMPDL